MNTDKPETLRLLAKLPQSELLAVRAKLLEEYSVEMRDARIDLVAGLERTGPFNESNLTVLLDGAPVCVLRASAWDASHEIEWPREKLGVPSTAKFGLNRFPGLWEGAA